MQNERGHSPERSAADRRWTLAIIVTLGVVFIALFDLVMVWSTHLGWGHDDVTPFGLIGLAFTIFGVVLAAAIFIVQQRAAAAGRAEDSAAFERIEQNLRRVRQLLARAQRSRTRQHMTLAQLDEADDLVRELQRLAPAMVLWVDDNPEWVENERAILDETGSRSVLVRGTGEALALLGPENDFDLVITDMARGAEQMAGYKLLAGVVERSPGLPVIVYSSSDDPAHDRQWREAGGLRSTYEPIGLFEAVVDALGG